MEYLPSFDLHRPQTADEAVSLRASDPSSRYLAGGTDMIVNVRRGIEKPTTLIDVTAIGGLTGISASEHGIRIGAGVRLRDVVDSDLVQSGFPAVAEAAAQVAGPTHRQYGTVGGNLCLDTRCIYYNQSQWWRESNNFCLKHLGDVCHVAPGGKRCFAAFSGDVAPAMLLYGAEVDLVGPDGTRTLPLAEIYNNDGMNHLALGAGELVCSVSLKSAGAGVRSGYEKSRIRGSIDFPLAGVAARLRMEEGRIGEISIALTGVNPYPLLVKGCDKLVGRALDENTLDSVRDMVRTQAKPMRTTTVRPWYRRRVIGALARRLVLRLAGI